MAKKRDRVDIVFDILQAIRQKREAKIKPTHLMYKANLTHKQLKLYIEELEKKQFVEKLQVKTGELITITDRGYEFINKVEEMKKFEETFGI